jgi:hypothetical protein
MKINATVIPIQVYDTFKPSGSSRLPTHPFEAYSVVRAMPATAVGKANGRSTMASTTFLPGKR